MQDTPQVDFDLFSVIRKLEIQKGAKIPIGDIAKGAGLHRNTIQRIQDNETDRVDLKTLAKLLAYFKAEGMPITLGDLFKVEDTAA